jgi:hypothetical protein
MVISVNSDYFPKQHKKLIFAVVKCWELFYLEIMPLTKSEICCSDGSEDIDGRLDGDAISGESR